MRKNIKRMAEQIIERIAKANGTSPEIMRSQINAALENIVQDRSQPHWFMLEDLFPDGRPTTDEFVVALEHTLYDSMIPQYEGREWDGFEYRNIALQKRIRSDEENI